MSVLKSLVAAFACFTAIPMPRVEWDGESMRFMMAWFPVVGLAVGALVALWCLASDALGFGAVLRAAGIALVPLAVTGGFHLDGFADVVDAVSSHAEPERKRAILKDPHIGSFAAIGIAAYLVAYFALATEVAPTWQATALLACTPVMSRCASAWATTLFKGAGEGGTLALFRDSANTRAAVVAAAIAFAAATAFAIWTAPIAGIAMAVATLLCLAATRAFARRQFGGMSGDVAGFLVQVCELALVGCVAFAL